MNRFATTLCVAVVTALILGFGSSSLASFANSVPEPKLVDTVASGASLTISEILPNPAGDEKTEFVELYNSGETIIPLHKLKLVRDDTDEKEFLALSDEEVWLEPDSYFVYRPNFSLVNNKSITLQLYYVDSYAEAAVDLLLQQVSYPADITEGSSLQFIRQQWYVATATPDEPPPPIENAETPPEDSEETPDDEQPPVDGGEDNPSNTPEDKLCTIKNENVRISEILANPSGSDSDGGEFVELYNRGNKKVALTDCLLSTDKLDAYEFKENATIAPKSYATAELFNGLLNGGGEVTFSTEAYDETIEYPELDDDQAYAKIDGKWQTTKKATPGKANRQPTAVEQIATLNARLGACPAGQSRSLETHRCSGNHPQKGPALEACDSNQFRNPATNRCKLKSSTAIALESCAPNQFRNPATNRCKLKSSGNDNGLKPCASNQFRNPETNRCKLKNSDDDLKPCEKDQYRSSETNRCRKKANLSDGVLGAESDESEKSSNKSSSAQNILILIVAGAFLLLFLLYEYRLAIRDWLGRWRPKKH